MVATGKILHFPVNFSLSCTFIKNFPSLLSSVSIFSSTPFIPSFLLRSLEQGKIPLILRLANKLLLPENFVAFFMKLKFNNFLCSDLGVDFFI